MPRASKAGSVTHLRAGRAGASGSRPASGRRGPRKGARAPNRWSSISRFAPRRWPIELPQLNDEDSSTLAPLGLISCRATVSDAAIIARHRVEMFRDMGQVPADELATTLLKESTSALAVWLADGSYVGWLARDAHQVVAGV